MPQQAIIPIDTDPDGPGTGGGASAVLGPLDLAANNLGAPSTRGATFYLIKGGTNYTTLVLEGSHNGVNYFPAIDYWGNAISLSVSANNCKVLGANYRYLKVTSTGGDGTSTLEAHVSL